MTGKHSVQNITQTEYWNAIVSREQVFGTFLLSCRATRTSLLSLVGTKARVGVEHLNIKLGGTLDDLLALLGRNIVGDLGGVGRVVHQQQVKIGNIVNAELEEVVGQHSLRALVRAIPDLNKGTLALEATTHSAVDTLGLAVGILSEQRRAGVRGAKEQEGSANDT